MQERQNSYSKRVAHFWKNAFQRISNSRFQAKSLSLPLARIKRLMKVEENVKMVASEVPILFSLVAEVFIEELTLRAWMSTEDGKRKILQIGDISFAARTSPMYDFLVHIVPSNEFPSRERDQVPRTYFLEQYPFQDGMKDHQFQ